MESCHRFVWASGFLLLALVFVVSGCSRPGGRGAVESGQPRAGTVTGIFPGSSGGVSVEVELENNRIAHIELLSHGDDSTFEKKAINAIDLIVWKNSVDAVEGSPELESLLEAVRQALRTAGVTPAELGKAGKEPPAGESPTEEVSADLVVVGAGCAGLCAAIEAKDLGVDRIVILEKMSFAGGNTRMSNGCYAAPDNWLERKAGTLDDGPERFFQDMDSGAYHTGNPALIRVLANGALDGALWLRDSIGMRFQDQLTWYEGHSRVRGLRALGDGYRFVDTLLAAAEKRGISIHYTTRAIRILRDAGGLVTGIEAERGGKKLLYRSSRGVILATGGFGANIQMRQKYRGKWKSLDASVLTSNSPGSTGDGIVMAQEAGAALVDMEYIQLYPINNPATGNLYLLDYARLNDNALLLNREGRRFVNERATRDVIAASVIAQPAGMAYELIDRQTIRRMKLEEVYSGEIERCQKQGVLVEGSLESCATYFGLPLSVLKETIARFNGMVERGRDEDFGRDGMKPIDGGPYLMFSSVVSVHHTMGGIRIDTRARVLDRQGLLIPHFFAAGEVTGGIHGSNRLGSDALADGVVFGRIAARSAAREP